MHPDEEVDGGFPVHYPSKGFDSDLENRFTYHAPKDAIQVEKYARIRDIAKNYAYTIKEMTPASREQSLALTHLEECVFWANAAMARHGEK